VPISPILEYEQTFNPFRDQLSRVRLSHEKGFVDVPTGPGLGIDINREILDKYRVA
jgi:D-galactarolactone cycloisomerase